METPAPRRKERREKRERFMGGGSGSEEGRARSFPRSGEAGVGNWSPKGSYPCGFFFFWRVGPKRASRFKGLVRVKKVP
jgi:hypothetical protein